MDRSLVPPALAVAALAALAVCSRSPTSDPRLRASPPEDVLARVNGVPITRTDVAQEARGDGHAGAAPRDEKAVLEGLVRQELAAQRAVELGLDPGPEYRAELGRIEAQVAAFRRRKLAELYDRQAAAKVVVSDEEARRYYEEQGARIRTELHVWQILLRDEARIEQARRDLEKGVPFEEAARRQVPDAPVAAGAFWDMGWLRFGQVPEPWQETLAGLEPGQTSGVIRGPRNRFWIVKLVGRRESPDVTFESAKATVVDALRNARIEALRAQGEKDLRAGARIVYEE